MRLVYVSGMGQVWGAYSPEVLDRPDAGTVGGGEAAMLESAFALAKRGHALMMFYPGDRAEYRGVSFRPLRDAYRYVSGGDYDTLLTWSDSVAIRLAPSNVGRVFVQQLNNPPQGLTAWLATDVLVGASATHVHYLFDSVNLEWAGRHVPILMAMPSGYRPERYVEAPPLADRGPVVGYWSSPDRGLHHLLSIWPAIRRAVPEATLRIFYHLQRFIKSARDDSMAGEIQWRAKILDRLTHPLPEGATDYGPIGRIELARHQMETRVHAYPCDPIFFTEGFGVAILEGLAAGCHVVARPVDAFPEVYGAEAVTWVPGGVCDEAWLGGYTTAVIDALKAPRRNEGAVAAVLDRYKRWEATAAALEGAIGAAWSLALARSSF